MVQLHSSAGSPPFPIEPGTRGWVKSPRLPLAYCPGLLSTFFPTSIARPRLAGVPRHIISAASIGAPFHRPARGCPRSFPALLTPPTLRTAPALRRRNRFFTPSEGTPRVQPHAPRRGPPLHARRTARRPNARPFGPLAPCRPRGRPRHRGVHAHGRGLRGQGPEPRHRPRRQAVLRHPRPHHPAHAREHGGTRRRHPQLDRQELPARLLRGLARLRLRQPGI